MSRVHNLLSCLVRYGDIALPIGYEAVKKEQVYSDIKTHKQKRKSIISKYELFRLLVQQAVNNHVPGLRNQQANLLDPYESQTELLNMAKNMKKTLTLKIEKADKPRPRSCWSEV